MQNQKENRASTLWRALITIKKWDQGILYGPKQKFQDILEIKMKGMKIGYFSN